MSLKDSPLASFTLMESSPALTGIKDVDRFILLQVNVEDYPRLKLTCRYLYTLLSEDSFWCDKIGLLFGKEFTIREKISITWREWYLFWLKHTYTLKLIKVLNFTPEQAYLSNSSAEGRITFGMEAFQTIHRTLSEALQSRDLALVKYYLTCYRHLVKRIISNKEFSIELLIDYPKAIQCFFEMGFSKTAEELVDVCSIDDRFVVQSEDIIRLAFVLGYWNREDLYDKCFPITQDEFPTERIAYILGHAKAKRNKIACALLDKYYKDNMLKWLPLNLLDEIGNDKFIGSLYHKAKNQDKDLLNTYIVNTFRLRTTSITSEITYDEWTYDDFVHAYENSKSDDEAKTILVDSIIFGRYDFALSYESKLDCYGEKEWFKFLSNISITDYKDLYLYFLVKFAEKYPTSFNDYLQRWDTADINYESWILESDLLEIPIDLLSRTDFYSLLSHPYQTKETK